MRMKAFCFIDLHFLSIFDIFRKLQIHIIESQKLIELRMQSNIQIVIKKFIEENDNVITATFINLARRRVSHFPNKYFQCVVFQFPLIFNFSDNSFPPFCLPHIWSIRNNRFFGCFLLEINKLFSIETFIILPKKGLKKGCQPYYERRKK